MTVAELLDMEQCRGLKIIAGKNGLNREILTVSVMDYLDIYNWMKGGEFLITSGGPLKDHPQFMKTLLLKLYQRNVACFGIKTDRFLVSIPSETIDFANEIGFPVIFIPNHYAFTDIIHPVLNNIIFEQGEQLKLSNELHRAFTNLAIQEAGIDRILDVLGEIISQQVAFYSYQFSELYLPRSCEKFRNQLSRYDFPGDITQIKSDFATFEVKNKSSNYGLIILDSPLCPENPEIIIALNHASTVLILESQKRISKYHKDEKFKLEIIHDIIYQNIRSESELNTRAHICGWDFTTGGIVAIVAIDYFEQSNVSPLSQPQITMLDRKADFIYRLSEKTLTYHFSTVACMKLNDYFVFIISDKLTGTVSELQKICISLQEDIYRKTGFTCTIGIGNLQTSCIQLSESYQQARQCITIYRNIKKTNSLVTYNDLGLYKIASLLVDTPAGSELLDKFIGKILDYDKQFQAELMKTFVAICNHNWNLKEASRSLFVHYNTVKYRYDRICTLTGCNFETLSDKCRALLALKIYEMFPDSP